MIYIDVVAGIIFDENRHSVLLARRKPKQHQGGLWEFPGGKQESGESQKEALRRELYEEIAIRPDAIKFRRSIEHCYNDKAVRLHFWDVNSFTGAPKGCEGQVLQWVLTGELAQFSFPAANRSIVEELSR